MTLVKELMATHPHMISPDCSLRTAAEQMKKFSCGSLVVGLQPPYGIITDRDIVVYGLAAGHNPDTALVRIATAPDAITCYDDQTVEQAADEMADNDVRRLIVLNRQEKVVGVISSSDILKCPDKDAVNERVIHHLFKFA